MDRVARGRAAARRSARQPAPLLPGLGAGAVAGGGARVRAPTGRNRSRSALVRPHGGRRTARAGEDRQSRTAGGCRAAAADAPARCPPVQFRMDGAAPVARVRRAPGGALQAAAQRARRPLAASPAIALRGAAGFSEVRAAGTGADARRGGHRHAGRPGAAHQPGEALGGIPGAGDGLLHGRRTAWPRAASPGLCGEGAATGPRALRTDARAAQRTGAEVAPRRSHHALRARARRVDPRGSGRVVVDAPAVEAAAEGDRG